MKTFIYSDIFWIIKDKNYNKNFINLFKWINEYTVKIKINKKYIIYNI